MRWLVVDALLIGLLALVLRLVNLDAYPDWYYDEGTYALGGWNYWHGVWGYNSIAPNFGAPLVPLVLGFFETLLGRSFFIARLPAAVAGAATCGFLYLLVRNLYSRPVAIMAALFLSISALGIQRLAMMDNMVLFFFLASALAYQRWVSTEQPRWGLGAGLLAGLAFLSKYSGGATLAFLILQAASDRRLRRSWIMVVPFIITAMISPLIGAILDWNAFLSDTLELTERVAHLDFVVRVITMGDLFNPWATDTFRFTLWATLGFVLLFYVLGRRHATDRLLFHWALAFFAAYIFFGNAFWVFVIVVLPVYALALAIFLDDLWNGRPGTQLILIMVLLGALAPLSYPHLYPEFVGRYGRYLLLSVVGAIVLGSWAKTAWGEAGRWRGFVGLLPHRLGAVFILALALALSVATVEPVFSDDAAKDQRAVVEWLNAHLEAQDLAAVSSTMTFLIEPGTAYIRSEVALYNVGESFKEWRAELLPRYKVDLSLSKFRYFVYDIELTHWGPFKKVADEIRSSWMPVYRSGPYTIYENPLLFDFEITSLLPAIKAQDCRVATGSGRVFQRETEGPDRQPAAFATLTPKGEGRVVMSCNPPGTWNLTKVDRLALRVYYSTSEWYEYYVGLRDEKGRNAYWPIVYYPADTWRQVIILRGRASTVEPDFDWSRVTEVVLAAFDPFTPRGEIKLGMSDLKALTFR